MTMARLPFFKLIAILQILLLVHRHLQGLSREDRRRMRELVSHGHRLTSDERRELRTLAAKLEPGQFARAAARHAVPFGKKRR
jgi:triphosphoribosyl-dephospho-CoA synthetase